MRSFFKVLISFVALAVIFPAAGHNVTPVARHETVTTVASADGSPITYAVRGQGHITIVFIHCWTCNHEFWRPQIEAFSKKYRVVWLDLAGHGLSGSNRTKYTMEAFGEDVAAVVNEIGSKKVVLVGHSMGGPVAIEAANILGDRVIGVVGVDTFFTPSESPKSEAEIGEFMRPFRDDYKTASETMVRSMILPGVDPELANSIVDQMLVTDSDLGISAMYELFKWSAQNIPDALYEHSDILRNINSDPLGNAQPIDDSVVLIPGVGHFVAQVKPHEFNKALKKILLDYQTKYSIWE